MKTYTYLKVITVACAGALASCATQPQTRKMPVSASLRPDTSLSARIFQEVNSYRRSHGVSDVQRHAGLDRLAQEHCEYLRQHHGEFQLYGKNVSHFGFEGRALMAREAYQMENVSENVAAANHPGSNSAAIIVELWAASKDHEYNMRGAWTQSGIGVVVDSDGTVYATQLFATVTNSQMTIRERFNHF
ncbi:MAG: CAP domain-containing protein [Luteolibacter sp.]